MVSRSSMTARAVGHPACPRPARVIAQDFGGRNRRLAAGDHHVLPEHARAMSFDRWVFAACTVIGFIGALDVARSPPMVIGPRWRLPGFVPSASTAAPVAYCGGATVEKFIVTVTRICWRATTGIGLGRPPAPSRVATVTVRDELPAVMGLLQLAGATVAGHTIA